MGIIICERVILFFLGLMIFFLPISKAVIEVSASICIVFWVIKQRIVFSKKISRDNSLCCRALFMHGITLNKAVILFAAATLVTIPFSFNIKLSITVFIFKLAEYIMIFFVTRDVINSKARYKLILWVILLSLLFISADGIFQIINKVDLFRHRKLFQGRVTASFINPNDLGSYLITVIPITFALIFSKVKNKNIFGLLIAISVISCTTLMLTLSKGAITAFVLSLAFFCLYTKKRYSLFILSGILLLLLVLHISFNFSFTNFTTRIFSFINDTGAIDRKFLWLAALSMFIHKPVFGVGLGTFMESYQKFWLRPTAEISYAHNCYLQVLAETGIIGLAAFLSFLFIWFAGTLKTLSRRADSFYSFSFLGLSTGLVAYLINSFVDTNFYSLPIAVLFWFILGLQQAGMRLISDEREH